MKRLSYKDECGVHEHMHIETFKRRAVDKRLRLIINKMSVIRTTKNLKNKAILI